MAKKPADAAPSASEYEPDAIYDVTLNAVVKINGLKFLPRDQHHMKGAFLTKLQAENPDAIGSATKRG